MSAMPVVPCAHESTTRSLPFVAGTATSPVTAIGAPCVGDVLERITELADPLALMAFDQTDAPRQRFAAAPGDAGVDERVEHRALAEAQPRHHRHRGVREQVALAVDLDAPRHLAPEAV